MPTVLWRLPSFSLTSGVVARTHTNGKAHFCGVHGKVTTTAITIQRRPGLLDSSLVTGKGTLAGRSTFADLGSPTPFQRFITHQIPTACDFDEGLDDEREQLPTHC